MSSLNDSSCFSEKSHFPSLLLISQLLVFFFPLLHSVFMHRLQYLSGKFVNSHCHKERPVSLFSASRTTRFRNSGCLHVLYFDLKIKLGFCGLVVGSFQRFTVLHLPNQKPRRAFKVTSHGRKRLVHGAQFRHHVCHPAKLGDFGE